MDTPTASTPYGVPTRLRPDFEFQPSPVIQEDTRQGIYSTLPHIRSARTVDQENIRETRIDPAHSTLPHIASARTGDHEDIRETCIDPASSTLPHIVSACTGDHEDIRESRNTLPHIRCARTGEHNAFWDARTRIRTTFENITPSGTRAPENTATTETRATENCNFDSTNDPHTRTTERTAETCNRIHITLAIIHRWHARHRARRFRHLMEQTQPNSVPG